MAKAKYKYNEQRKEWITLVWDGTYNEKGEKHRKRISSKKSSADLEKKVNEFKRKVEDNNFYEYSEMSFYQYAIQWEETTKSSKEKNTRAVYQNIIHTHLSFLDDVRIGDVMHSHFQMAINRQMDHPKTCQLISVTFRQIIKAAIRDRILPRMSFENICDGISMPKYHKPEKRALSEDERNALQAADFNEMQKALVSTLFYSGIRRGELLALTPFDFNWEKKELSINKSVICVKGHPELKLHPKSDNGIRKIPLPDEAVKIIRPYVEKCNNAYLFANRDGNLMSQTSFYNLWKNIITQMNKAVGYVPRSRNSIPKQFTDLTPHIFRHNYCTMLCYQVPKISTKMIAKLMGDTEKVVLEVYSHICEEKENVKETVNEALVL